MVRYGYIKIFVKVWKFSADAHFLGTNILQVIFITSNTFVHCEIRLYIAFDSSFIEIALVSS